MPRLLIIICFLYLLGCDQNGYPIVDSKQHLDFRMLKEEDDKGPKDQISIRRKLWMSQKNEWPDDCRPDFEKLLSLEELDYELLVAAMDCYHQRKYWDEMLTLLSLWEEMYPFNHTLITYKITALAKSGGYAEASASLWNFMINQPSENVYEFGASTYLEMGDTVRAIYALEQLATLNPAHPEIVSTYVPLLVKNGYPEKALRLMDNTSLTDEQLIFKATALYQMGAISDAHQVLSTLAGTRVWSLRVAWYEARNQYDSAVYFADQILQADSSTSNLLLKARLLEHRGWLNSSYALYQSILEIAPMDSIAQERARIVGRKIAYLRSLKEAEGATRPFLEIKSKKSINE